MIRILFLILLSACCDAQVTAIIATTSNNNISTGTPIPLDQADLFAWYKPSMVDTDDAVYEYDATIKGLDDLSGHRRDMYNSTSGQQPSLTTGYAAFNGSGGNTGTRMNVPFRPHNLFALSGFSIVFAIDIPDGFPSVDKYLLDHTFDSNNRIFAQVLTNGKLLLRFRQGGTNISAQTLNAVYTDGAQGIQFIIFQVDCTGEQMNIFTANTGSGTFTQQTLAGSTNNGNFATLTMSSYADNVQNLIIGANGLTSVSANTTLSGNLYELIFTSKVLATQEKTDLLAYLIDNPETVTRYDNVDATASDNTSTNKLRQFRGQSQLDGRNTPDTGTYPYLASAITRSYTWDRLFNNFAPLLAGTNGCNSDVKRVGALFPLAQRLQTDNPSHTFYYLQNSEGGTDILSHSPGGQYWNEEQFNLRNAVNTLLSTSAGVHTVSVTWAQGEADSQPEDSGTYTLYGSREATLIPLMRNEFDYICTVNLHSSYNLTDLPYVYDVKADKIDNTGLSDVFISTDSATTIDGLHVDYVSSIDIADDIP